MDPKVIQELLAKNAELKKATQAERKRVEEFFIKLKSESKEFEMDLTSEDMFVQFSTLYNEIFGLWEYVLDFERKMILQSILTNDTSAQNPLLKEQEKLNSQILVIWEELKMQQDHLMSLKK